MKKPASPTPWAKDVKNGRIILSKTGERVVTCRAAGPKAWKDADAILAAVNLHADCIAALREVADNACHSEECSDAGTFAPCFCYLARIDALLAQVPQ